MNFGMLFPVADVAVGPVVTVGVLLIILVIAAVAAAVAFLIRAILKRRNRK